MPAQVPDVPAWHVSPDAAVQMFPPVVDVDSVAEGEVEVAASVEVGVNFSTRKLPASTTYTSPVHWSTATPCGELKSPPAVPELPNENDKTSSACAEPAPSASTHAHVRTTSSANRV